MTITDTFNTLLATLTDSKVYTDIKQMYENNIIDRKTYESMMVNFHTIVLPAALQTSRDLELQLQEVEIDDGNGGTKKVTLQQAQILGELERNKLIEAQRGEIEKTVTVTNADGTTRDVTLQQVKILAEYERKALIETQKVGFLDNRVIKLTEIMRGLVGEIESGGLSNPQANWDMLYASINALAVIASEHPQVGDITVPPTPPAPQH